MEKFQVENDQLLVAYEIDVKKKRVFFMDVGQHEKNDFAIYLRKKGS